MIKWIAVLCSLCLTGCCGIGVMSFLSMENELKTDFFTKEQLLNKRGTPDKIIRISDTEEDLIYSNGVGWSGLVPYVALGLPIPVPLSIPTHSKYIKYHVISNFVQAKTEKDTKISGCFIGYVADIEGAGTGNKWMSSCD